MVPVGASAIQLPLLASYNRELYSKKNHTFINGTALQDVLTQVPVTVHAVLVQVADRVPA